MASAASAAAPRSGSATAIWPGYPERTEFHGTKGTAVITGDKLTTWDVENDAGEPAPIRGHVCVRMLGSGLDGRVTKKLH